MTKEKEEMDDDGGGEKAMIGAQGRGRDLKMVKVMLVVLFLSP